MDKIYSIYMDKKSLIQNIKSELLSTHIETFYTDEYTFINDINNENIITGLQYNTLSTINLTIPVNITQIAANAFNTITQITQITLGNNVKYIGYNAFSGISISSIVIPTAVTYLGISAFSDCKNLTTITFEQGSTLTTIEKECFNNTSIDEIILPNSLSIIGDAAFCNCTNLTKITGNEYYIFNNNLLYNKSSNKLIFAKYIDSITIIDTIVNIGKKCFYKYKATTISIPNSVTEIGENAFDSSSIININISNSVKIINAFMFNNTSISNIIISNQITSIGSNAFSNCTKLVSISIPKSVINIDKNAFLNTTNITTITINRQIATISNIMKNITTLYIPDEDTFIADNAFDNSNKTLPKLTNVYIHDNITTIGGRAFQKCMLTRVYINNTSNLTRINIGAFYQCNYLLSFLIPSKVTILQDTVFYECGSMTHIYIYSKYLNTNRTDGFSPFYACHKLTNVSLSVDFFKWRTLINIELNNTNEKMKYNINDDATILETDAFKNTYIKSVNMPITITHIGSTVFSGCTKLTNITIPTNVTSIGSNAFDNCSSLTNISIYCPNTSVSGATYFQIFNRCINLKQVIVYNDIQAWKDWFGNKVTVLTRNPPTSVATGNQTSVATGNQPTSVAINNLILKLKTGDVIQYTDYKVYKKNEELLFETNNPEKIKNKIAELETNYKDKYNFTKTISDNFTTLIISDKSNFTNVEYFEDNSYYLHVIFNTTNKKLINEIYKKSNYIYYIILVIIIVLIIIFLYIKYKYM